MKKLLLPIIVFAMATSELLPSGCEWGNAEHFRQRATAKEKKIYEEQQKAMEEAYNY